MPRKPSRKIPYLVRDKATGRWFWKPSPALRPHWRSRPLGEDRAQAETEALRLNREVETWRKTTRPAQTPEPERGAPTVARLAAAYLASADFRLLAETTRASYRLELKRIEAQFGDMRVAAVSTRDVDEWLDALRMDHPESARHLGARARALWNWGWRKRLAPPSNPWEKAKLGAGGKRDVHTDLDGLRALVRAADRLGLHSLGTAAIIGFTAIARESDALTLTRAHLVTAEGGRVRLVYEQSKSRRRRSAREVESGVVIDVACPRAILTRLVTHPPAPSRDGCLTARPLKRASPDGATARAWTMQEAARAWRKIAETAAKESGRPDLAKVHLRDMRRSGFVHAAYTAHVPIAVIAALSGHSHRTAYEMAEHYAPRTKGAADQTVEAMKVEI